MEDAIEQEFVDRVAKDSPDLKYKILRGSLAPAHTFSNLFAMKTPWFRYPEEGSFSEVFGGPLHKPERPLMERRTALRPWRSVHLDEPTHR